jgi:hypothetical protein
MTTQAERYVAAAEVLEELTMAAMARYADTGTASDAAEFTQFFQMSQRLYDLAGLEVRT